MKQRQQTHFGSYPLLIYNSAYDDIKFLSVECYFNGDIGFLFGWGDCKVCSFDSEGNVPFLSLRFELLMHNLDNAIQSNILFG